MKIFASYKSVISGAEIRFELQNIGDGVAFVNVETGKIELGTFCDSENKFESLDLFRKIFGEMKPSFELL